MRTAIRIASKIMLGLGLTLLFAIAVVPWVIGSAGGSGAGMVAYGLMLIGMTTGIPTASALIAIGGVGAFLAKAQS